MSINIQVYHQLLNICNENKISLVAVSKTKPYTDITELYNAGQRIFGENYVQELVEKQAGLPKDIQWHFLGHLQTNKVKYIAPFVSLIHGVDSKKLLVEIDKQAKKLGIIIDVLLQMHIAKEDTKFGMDEIELMDIIENWSSSVFSNVNIKGLMGMASFSDNKDLVFNEFRELKKNYDIASKLLNNCNTLSMGMSGDYEWAIECGSNMIRVGSLIFGSR